MADDLDAVRGGDDLAGAAALDIAARLDRQIDDDRPWGQLGHHCFGQQYWRAATGDKGRTDDDIRALQRLGDLLALPALVVLAHLASIALSGLRGPGGLVIDGDKGRTEALDLLLGGGTHIGRGND